MRVGPIYCAVAFLLAVALLAGDGQSQTTTSGGLSGVVIDQTNAVVPDAAVEIKDTAKGTTQSAKTDGEGAYHFSFLRPGRYTLKVTHIGFQEERKSVTIQVGPPATVNVTLEVAKASSEIAVSDEAPIIQAETADVSVTMTQTQVSEVPNPGNDLTYIAQTAPGAVMNTDLGTANQLGNFSILGMPGTSYEYTIDGMNNNFNAQNISMGGSLGLVLGQNQIQEASVVSTGYSGQFGGSAGGSINYVTKSGSNAFHGNAQYYWNGRALNSNDWFANSFGVPRPFSIANQWAGSFGGPIKKDSLFVFFNTEGLRLLIPQFFFVNIPSPEFEAATIANIDFKIQSNQLTAASHDFYEKIFNLYNTTPGADRAIPGAFGVRGLGCGAGFSGPNGVGSTVPCGTYFEKTRGRPSQDALTSGRVDWNASKNDRASLRVQGESGVGAFYSDAISSIFDADYDVSVWQGQLLETHTFGPNAASQLLVAASDYDFVWGDKYPAQARAAFPTAMNFYAPVSFSTLGGTGFGAYGIKVTQYQISEDLVKTRGSHKFGLGASLLRIHWRVPPNTVNATGQLSPQTLDAFYQGGIDLATPSRDFTSLIQSFTSQPAVPVSFLRFATYGQDEWHARPDLTITFALRLEHHSNPECESACFARPSQPFESMSHDPGQPYNQAILINQKHALQNVDKVQWSPRLSFAWQPLGVIHKIVLRGGVGIFYDPLREGMSESFYINTPTYNVYSAFANNLTPDESSSLFKDTAASNAAFVNGFAAGKTLAQIQSSDPNSFSTPSLNDADERMPAPQYQKWSLELEQGLGANTSLSLGYFGNHGIHELVVNPSANAFGFGSLPAAPCSSPPVPPCSDPRFSQVTQYGMHGISNYHGMVATFRHRFTRSGGLIQVNYTYGHAFDEVSNGGFLSFTQGGSIYPQDPNNLRGAYGPAEYDVRHSLNANYVWELPLKALFGGRSPDSLVRGWQLSGTIFDRTGFPYTALDIAKTGSLQQNNYFGRLYSVPVGRLPSSSSCGEGAAVTMPLHPCLPAQFYVLQDGSITPNPNALFVQAGCETGFNEGRLGSFPDCLNGPAVSFAQGRNHFRGPGYFNTDLAIMKNTKIGEHTNLGIGFQFFNLFNHPNFGLPLNWSSDAGFGQTFYMEQSPTGILGAGLGGDASPRMIQLRVQLRF